MVVATFGDFDYWNRLATRAVASVRDAEVIRVHGKTLAAARNTGAKRAQGDRLVFLDADDELAPDFISRIVEPEDILQPLTSYEEGGVWGEPFYHLPAPKLTVGNHIVVGAPVKRDLFLESGGFDEYSFMEDWALWLKLHSMGATLGKTSGVYMVHRMPNSRNSTQHNDTVEEIRKRFS